eukprot:GHUV01027300.1.p1 GENE.GHUV01027300.1~~GHUV01027300.1.p1  ORF type:complete len:188 (-),score=16.41 GHUV01027300.1:941-1504(-)
MTSHASRLKEALAGGQAKDKGPVVADGVLTVTPDSPEAGWGPSVLDTVSADSSFLEDDGGKSSSSPRRSPLAAGKVELIKNNGVLRSDRQATQPTVWQVHLEDRQLLSNQQSWHQTGAQKQPVQCWGMQVVHPGTSGAASTAVSRGAAECCLTNRHVLQVYPQGCDVCNHLSLFLCVADYDKLLPGA